MGLSSVFHKDICYDSGSGSPGVGRFAPHGLLLPSFSGLIGFLKEVIFLFREEVPPRTSQISYSSFSLLEDFSITGDISERRHFVSFVSK